jgi:sialic acid synthase SpsE/mannose-6-phosphate isomerase-like protein (cupin superfamily)
MKYTDKPLFTFEMANNHMGDVSHGVLIIREFGKLVSEFPEFNFSMKLQYRDNSFFHPKHIDRKDHRLIKRFTETRLKDEEFRRLIDEVHACGMISMCTPWDEKAVDYQMKMGVQVLKIASCSFTDWSLLEKIATVDVPIIASTAGASEEDIKNVSEFLKNRSKEFAILHCVGEYPCEDENLELNQIDYLKSLLSVPVGYSTHENPENCESISIALAKGAVIFEKHVGVANEKYSLNAYSANPSQARKWLLAARRAYLMCGGDCSVRKGFSEKEVADLRILYRGCYAKRNLTPGAVLGEEDFFLAMPNTENQIVAKDLGKYKKFTLIREIQAGEPIFLSDVEAVDKKKIVTYFHGQIRKLIKDSQILLPRSTYVEISHHYGIDRFAEVGAALIHLINRDYSKIVVIMLAGQTYPLHKHVTKDETYYVLFGSLIVNVAGTEHRLGPGQTLSVARGIEHSFRSDVGVVFEEIATRYIKGDSVYSDEQINSSSHRKTVVPL